MATSTCYTTDDILICSICLEEFKCPKYLPCLHTFCEGCISTFIASCFEKGNKLDFACPVCRGVVSNLQEKCSSDDVAKHLPVNFLIVGLLDLKKIHRPEKRCMSCERLGIESTAAYLCVNCSDTLCDTCNKCHTANKVSADHEIRSLSDVFPEDKMPKTFASKCSEHTNKKIKLFCKDHDIPCCSMCVSITHRKCEEIVAIEDAARVYLSENSVDKIQSELKEYCENMNTLISGNRNILEDLKSDYEVKSKTIEATCKEMMDKVRAFETERKAELLKIFEEKKSGLETRITGLENRLKAINYENETLQISKEKASDVQVLLELLKIRSQLKGHKKLLNDKLNMPAQVELPSVENFTEKIENLLHEKCKIPCSSVHKFNRFKTFETCWGMHRSCVNAISVQVSSDIYLVGILSFCCKQDCKITVTLGHESNILVEITTDVDKREAVDNVVHVEFPKAVKLSANQMYDIKLCVNTSNVMIFYYGTHGQAKVDHEGVTFTFESSLIYRNSSTSVVQGQIPGLLFKTIQ
ncbi:E3 ubiquitin-protein ligase TRIM56-like [Mytilus californianus]|uniref:E3 ubiquitin-protein ligase TRIM56-like n=1 Tax=Mytilus californianus TaxID=6549 RepID=UPI0022476D6D|nr:E3 ubiquitin-protein ligase TRIM56-like [Mytilus californianus]